MTHDNAEMQECIDNCNICRDECKRTLFQVCFEKGGRHTERAHVEIMVDCLEICQTAASFMLRGSEHHAFICGVCAEVCEACAESCERIGGAEMERCAAACRACAESCREMSRSMPAHAAGGGAYAAGILA